MDTTMGGSRNRFPATSLGMLQGARDLQNARYREHIERLIATYWKPVYYYVRRVWSKSDADAKDLTQGFFIDFLEYDVVGRFDASKGNFRAFLKHCLKAFLMAERRDAGRLKRGGGRQVVSLDAMEAAEAVPAPVVSPEDEFDRDWTKEVMSRAMAELEVHFKNRGRAVDFEVFRSHCIDPGDRKPPSYAELAHRLEITETDVRNALYNARRELRRLIVEIISEYTSDEEEMLTEIARILGGTK